MGSARILTPALISIVAALCLCACQQANVTGAKDAAAVATGGTSASAPTVSLQADKSSVASGQSVTLSWSSSNATSCTASNAWNGAQPTSGTASVAPTGSSTYTLTCTGTGGNASENAVIHVLAANATPRPSYNTGDGFFVLNGKLYDPSGLEFRVRGVDRNHYNSDSQPGLSRAHANTVRVFLYYTSIAAQTYATVMQNDHINYQEMPIPTMQLFPSGNLTSCNTSQSEFTAGVNWWVANASVWTKLDHYEAINIANEWGEANSTAWRDAYISAVAKLRAAGYTSPLVIDSGMCGQDVADFLTYASDVFNSDPQKNIIFSYHLYGGSPPWTVPTMQIFFDQLAALSKSAGMVFIIGEFGPGKNLPPSPTLITPGQVITAAESSGLGWMPWAWDANNLSGGKSNDSSYSMTYSGPGTYNTAADLTEYGKDIVLNTTYGLATLAQPPNF